ncbi:MAG: DUF6600 domain-containing protein [bacterium]
MIKILKVFSLIFTLTMTGVWAQGVETRPDQRSRISYVKGDVVMQPSTSGNTLEAVMNMPFMKGDRLATGSDGVFEFRLGDGVTGWGWYDTKIELMDSIMRASDQRSSVIKLWYGAVALRSFPMSYISHQISVELENGILYPDLDSLVRITLDSDLTAVYVTVVKGGALINLNDSHVRLEQGETWQGVMGTANWTRIRPLRDDLFDGWYLERDRLLQDSYEYTDQVPAEAAPAEYADQAAALHGYGKWIYIESGWYWMPYVASGWMPYHAGFWDFILPWGWIWIPYEPWGWTVYHYGYWRYFAGRGWMWYPSWYWRGHYAHWRYNPGHSVHWIAAHPDDDMDSAGMLREGAIPLNSRLAIGVPVEAAQTVDQLLNRVSVQRNANRLLSADDAKWRGSLPETLKPSMSRRQSPDATINEPMSRTPHPGWATGETPPATDIQQRQHSEWREGGVSRPSDSRGLHQAPKQPYRQFDPPRAVPGNTIQQPQQRAPQQRTPHQPTQQRGPQQQAPQHQQAPKPPENNLRGKQPAIPSKPKPPINESGLSENVSVGVSRTSIVTGNILTNLLKTGASLGVKGASESIGRSNSAGILLSVK